MGTEQKRAKVVDDAIIVEPEDESDYKEDQTGRAQILPFNRMAIRKRQIVTVDNDGETLPGTPEDNSDNSHLFRPLKRSIVSVDNEGQVSDGTPETGSDNEKYFRPLSTGYGKRSIVSVDNEGQTYQDNSGLFRPLPKEDKRGDSMMKWAKLPTNKKRSLN